MSRLLPSANAQASFAGSSHLSMDFRGNFEFLLNIFIISNEYFCNPRCTETAKCEARSSERALYVRVENTFSAFSRNNLRHKIGRAFKREKNCLT